MPAVRSIYVMHYFSPRHRNIYIIYVRHRRYILIPFYVLKSICPYNT